METLKFLMVATHYPPFNLGGDAVMVEYLSRELVKRGHEVEIFFNPTVYSALRKRKPVIAAGSTQGGPVLHPYSPRASYLNLVLTLSFDWSARARKRLDGLIHRYSPDVVHWHDTKGFIGVPFAPPGAVTLYTAHDYLFVCPRSNLARPDMTFCKEPRWCSVCTARWGKPPQLWRLGSKRVVHLPPEVKVLAPTEYMARRLREDGIQVHSVLNNFVPDPGAPPRIPNAERDSISFVGMLERHKGSPTLLEAFARCRDRQGFKLHIIGDGPLKQKLRRRATALGLSSRVDIPGFIPRRDLEAAVSRSATLVIPSEWPETSSLAAMEGLSMGVPLLASDQGGLPETAGTDSGSLLFRSGDADVLAEAIVSIWNRRDQLDALSKKARQAYEKYFSPSIHLTRYLKTVSDLRGAPDR